MWLTQIIFLPVDFVHTLIYDFLLFWANKSVGKLHPALLLQFQTPPLRKPNILPTPQILKTTPTNYLRLSPYLPHGSPSCFLLFPKDLTEVAFSLSLDF